MSTARHTLERLSSDPQAQRLAEQRELDRAALQIYRGAAFEEGKAEGRAEGKAEGEARGRVLTLCEVFGIELDEAKRGVLGTLSVEQLVSLASRIKAERKWPEAL
jgi:flagellar biosynthesis/type III secretory pathway protein FliH